MFRIETGIEIRKTQLLKSVKDTESFNITKARSSGMYLAIKIQQQLSLASNSLLNNLQPNRQFSPILPCLHQFSHDQGSKLDNYNKRRKNKIVQLVILAWMRMQHQMYSEAQNILMFIGAEMAQIPQFQYALKSLVYQLIFKNHKLIQNSKQNRTRNHGCFLMGNNFEYKRFKEELKNRVRKSNLIVQRQFVDLLEEADADTATSLKLPQQIHPQMMNYKLLVINIDQHSFKYSYIYPKVLTSFLPIEHYRFIIAKINHVLRAESNCFTVSSILGLNFIPVFTVILFTLLMFVVTVLAVEKIIIQTNLYYVIMAVLTAGVMCSAVKIHLSGMGCKNPQLISKEMNQILEKCNLEYSDRGIFIRPNTGIESFSIYIDKDKLKRNHQGQSSDESESQSESRGSSSFSSLASQNQTDHKQSAKKKRISISYNLQPDYFSRLQQGVDQIRQD